MSEKELAQGEDRGEQEGGIIGFIASCLVSLGLFLGRTLPLGISYSVAIAVVRVYALLCPAARKAVEKSLRGALGDQVSPVEMKRQVRENFRDAWARRQVDFVIVPKLDREFLDRNFEVVGLEKYERAKAEGRGVLLVTGHFGVAVLMAFFALPLLGAKALIPVRRLFDRRTEAKLMRVAHYHGGETVYTENCFRVLIKRLNSGGTVALAGDHLTSPRGVRVSYFGRDTLMPAGPAILAYRCRAAVVPCYCVRTAADRFLLEFGDPLPIPPTPEKIEESHLREVIQSYARCFEDVIRRYPSQWETLFPAWPDSFEEKDLARFYHNQPLRRSEPE